MNRGDGGGWQAKTRERSFTLALSLCLSLHFCFSLLLHSSVPAISISHGWAHDKIVCSYTVYAFGYRYNNCCMCGGHVNEKSKRFGIFIVHTLHIHARTVYVLSLYVCFGLSSRSHSLRHIWMRMANDILFLFCGTGGKKVFFFWGVMRKNLRCKAKQENDSGNNTHIRYSNSLAGWIESGHRYFRDGDRLIHIGSIYSFHLSLSLSFFLFLTLARNWN